MTWVELNWALGLTGQATLKAATDDLSGPSPFLITPIAATATLVIAALLSFAFPQENAAQAEQLSWRGVVFKTGGE